MAPSSSARSQSTPKAKYNAQNTKIPASSASRQVISSTARPVWRSVSFLKKRPTPKAIKASAKSLTNPILSTTAAGIIPIRWGPIKIPVKI